MRAFPVHCDAVSARAGLGVKLEVECDGGAASEGKKRSRKDCLGNARSCVVLSQRPYGHGCDANATSCSRRAVTADGKPGRGGIAWVRISQGSREKPLVVEWRERVRNATFGPRVCAQTCGKCCPQGVRHNAPKGHPCRERDCAATFMSQTVWHG